MNYTTHTIQVYIADMAHSWRHSNRHTEKLAVGLFQGLWSSMLGQCECKESLHSRNADRGQRWRQCWKTMVNSLCSPSQSECKVNTNFRQQKVTKVSASGGWSGHNLADFWISNSYNYTIKQGRKFLINTLDRFIRQRI